MARPAKNKSGAAADTIIKPRATQLAEAAREFRDNHHWVPLRLNGKAAIGKKWQEHTLGDPIPRFKDTDNIGILLGEPSGNLVRLDADFEAIPAVTSLLFPEPTLTFGRATSPRGGRLVTCTTKTKNFVLPKVMENHPGLPLHDGKPGLVVFQIMSTGSQAMVPPSIHPDSKEKLDWEKETPEPAIIDEQELRRRVGIEAFLMAVRQFWPALGTRNEAAMALSRVLLEALATHHPDDAERCAVVDGLVMATAMAGGDGEGSRIGKERAEATLEKMRAGEETTGMPRLVELLELPADVAKTFWKWLGGARAVIVREMRFPDVTQKGAPRASFPNAKVALQLLGVECRYDLFALRYEIEGHAVSQFAGTVTNSVFLELRSLIHAEFGFDPGKQHIEDAVYGHANHHRFHPVIDYLNSLTWDGTPRIDKWLIDYGGADDTPYVRAVGSIFLIAAVRRVRKPGSKFDEMLVLESPQGWNKSLTLRTLAVHSEWFTDQPLLGLSGKETIEQTSGKWIVEVAELQGMSKREVERVKAHLSSEKDTARLAYGRTTSEAKRQFVPIGTTNSDTYLRDITGNRRYWPVRVQRFDVEAVERDRDQLWAEAAQREAEGASIRLPEELWEVAAEEQEERLVENPFLSRLESLLRDTDGEPMEGKVTTDALMTALDISTGQRRDDHFKNLAAAMQTLGWEKAQRRVHGERSRVYLKGPEPHKTIEVLPRSLDCPANLFYAPEGERRPYCPT